MTQEEKQLSLKVLCLMLPYRVIVQVKDWTALDTELKTGHIRLFQEDYLELKPYLRPMSSMTKEELHEVQEILGKGVEIREDFIVSVDSSINSFTYLELIAVFEWLLKKHFDFMGLIPKGLAIEVTKENNPYKD